MATPAEAVPPRNRRLLSRARRHVGAKQTAAKVPGSDSGDQKTGANLTGDPNVCNGKAIGSTGRHWRSRLRKAPWWTCLFLPVLAAPVAAGASEPKLVVAPQIRAEVGTELDFHVLVDSTNPVPADCSIIITGLPKSVTFSAGSAIATGIWEVPLLALDRLKMVVTASEASRSTLIIFLAIKKKDDLVILASAHSVLLLKPRPRTHADSLRPRRRRKSAWPKPIGQRRQGSRSGEGRRGRTPTGRGQEGRGQAPGGSQEGSRRQGQSNRRRPPPRTHADRLRPRRRGRAPGRSQEGGGGEGSRTGEGRRGRTTRGCGQESGGRAPGRKARGEGSRRGEGPGRTTQNRCRKGRRVYANGRGSTSGEQLPKVSKKRRLYATRKAGRARGPLPRPRQYSRCQEVFPSRRPGGACRRRFQTSQTHDPHELARRNVQGLRPDPAEAKRRYTRASDLGASEAKARLGRLGD